ncbi:MAG: hypothetical protein AAFR70_07840 [Pseudomonadota bacterium]
MIVISRTTRSVVLALALTLGLASAAAASETNTSDDIVILNGKPGAAKKGAGVADPYAPKTKRHGQTPAAEAQPPVQIKPPQLRSSRATRRARSRNAQSVGV